MDSLATWRTYHVVIDGVCSCGEPPEDCFFWGLLHKAVENQYEELFADS